MVRRVPPLHGQKIAVLRAIASTPGGLRFDAYPLAMPVLEAMELVSARAAPKIAGREGGQVWILTPAGRRALDAYGRDVG